jgi:8-oxo-dGTP pyrophosphatase MutT (NUDIX family)
MIEFEIVARGLFRPDQLVIEYNPALGMPLTPEIQAEMETRWECKLTEARAQGTRLFDAPLFRFIAASTSEDRMLHVVMGDTSYKQYVTTREPAFAHGRSRNELSNALAVCSVVETCDDYILLDKRQGVDVYLGRYHVIGGFFERSLDMRQCSPDPFAAVQREIREETGIQADDIHEQYCLGIVYDLLTPHGEMCFLTRLHISLSEALARRPEDDEIQQIIPLQVNEESLRAFILRYHGHISATGEPNLLMYGGWKFGEAWFDTIMRLLA